MNIHETIGAVADLRRRVLDRQRFRGYSGVARAAGGTLALLVACVAHWGDVGANDRALFVAWGVVFIGAVVLNYGAVLWWWLTGRGGALAPALEPLPVLLVGGLLSVAVTMASSAWLLPCVWISVFGLTQFTAKYALPRAIRLVGCYYITAGVVVLGLGEWAWREPLLLGGVFFLGEWAGGLILHAETRALATAPVPSVLSSLSDDDEN